MITDDMSYTTDSYLLRNGIGKTPWAIYCNEHSNVYFSRAEYRTQLLIPDKKWICPICHEIAEWDDENYEDFMEKLEAYNLSPADEQLVEYSSEKEGVQRGVTCYCKDDEKCPCEECLTSEVTADSRLCCECHD